MSRSTFPYLEFLNLLRKSTAVLYSRSANLPSGRKLLGFFFMEGEKSFSLDNGEETIRFNSLGNEDVVCENDEFCLTTHSGLREYYVTLLHSRTLEDMLEEVKTLPQGKD